MSTTASTSFNIYKANCNIIGQWCKVGHGSVTRESSTWLLTVCDDKADGIGPYIDRDGGSYGTNGNGTCCSVYAIPEHWRVRWNGYATPWFAMP
jgi:hypothetical protein